MRRRKYAEQALNILMTIERLKTTGSQVEQECARRFQPPYGLTIADCRKSRVSRQQAQALIKAHSELVIKIFDRQHREAQRQQKSVAKYLAEQSSALRKEGWTVYTGLPPRLCLGHGGIEISFKGGANCLEDTKGLVEKLTHEKLRTRGIR